MFVTVPEWVLGRLSYKLWWFGRPKEHSRLGVKDFPKIFGTVIHVLRSLRRLCLCLDDCDGGGTEIYAVSLCIFSRFVRFSPSGLGRI